MAEQEEFSWVDALDLMLLSAFTAGWDAAADDSRGGDNGPPNRANLNAAWKHYRDNIGKEGKDE